MNRTQVARGIAIALSLGSTFIAAPAFANATAQPLPFSQSWTTGLITANDGWDGVPGIVGYNEELAGTTGGVDPQTRLSPMTTAKVLANQTSTTISNGGVAEFHIADPVVGFQGANTSDAPNLVIHIDTTGKQDIVVSYKLRDLDGSADDAVMQVALQYRIGTSGDFVNVPAGYVADATESNAATKVTPVSVTLPSAVNNAPMVQVRILTTNAVGNDEWVGVDDITITGTDTAPAVGSTLPADDATDVAAGASLDITFSEDVALNAAGVTLNCGSGALPFALTGGPRTFSVNPDADLPHLANCIVTIAASAVADADTIDPPDALDADYTFDFTVVAAGDAAPSVTSTAPADDATDVARDSSLDITFNEDVALSAAGVALNCGGNAQPFTLSGGPRTFTVNPDADLPDSASCVVTIAANAVADADAMDPPDALATDYTFDFTVAAPPVDPAPAVTASVPADNATNVVETADISLTFSEDVSLNVAGVTLDCGGAQAFALSGGPRTFTLNPDADLPNATNCVVTVAANAVADADAMDPPDALAADHVFDFTTVAAATAIGAVQGTGDESPLKDQTVTISGIVTAKASSAFWMQDAGDGNPATSDGIYVYGNPTAALVAVGDRVRVTGKVIEYRPNGVQQLYLTEISNTPAPTLVKLSSGNPLPAAVDLSLPANLPTANGGLLQLERFEGMRVTVPSLDVVSPNGSSEYSGDKFSDTFFGVVSGTTRPRREAGVDAHDLLPAGSPLNVPRWDANPELLRIRTNGVTGGGAFAVRAGSVVANVTGPLDYAYRRYTIQNQGAPAVTTHAPEGVAVTAPDARGFTVGSFNVENYADAAGTSTKTQKISRVIRDFMHAPDLLGFVEMGSGSFSTLSDKIDEHADAAGQPAPDYGTDVIGTGSGSQQLAVAYKRAEVRPGVPRVQILGWEQFGATENLRCPDGTIPPAPVAADPLLDRPPLLVRAQINHANGGSFPVSLLMLHMKSLLDVDSTGAPATGWECFATQGERNRAKRHQGAVYVANLVAARQTANPDERLVIAGDYNAYEVNDGYADVLGTIVGAPAADDQTVQPLDGLDLVTPDLFNLSETAPTPYSYVFGGHAQILDHMVVNQGLIDATLDTRVGYAHVNADYNSSDASNASVVMRSSDHDPVHLYASVVPFHTSDVAVAANGPATVIAGDQGQYTVTLTNNGSDAAHDPRLHVSLPAHVAIVSVTQDAGWTCSQGSAGATPLVQCSGPATLANGASANFAVDVAAEAGAPYTGTSAMFSASTASTDPVGGNDTDEVTGSILLRQDLTLGMVADRATAQRGDSATWTATIANIDHSVAADDVAFATTLPAGAKFASIAAAGWTCSTPAAGASGAVSCSRDDVPTGTSSQIAITATIAADAAFNSGVRLDGTVTTTSTESSTANNAAGATVTVLPPPVLHADLALALAGPAGTVDAGTVARYDVTLRNDGPDAAQNAQLTMNTPAHTRFAAMTAPAGWSCTTPAVGAAGTLTCTATSLANGATAEFDVDVTVDADASCCSIAASATASTSSDDAIAANDSAQATTTIATMPDLSLSMINNKGSAQRGEPVLWTATITNAVGAKAASDVVFAITLPATVQFASVGTPNGWSCTTPAVGSAGAMQCSIASLAGGTSAVIELSTTIAPNAPINSTIAMDASVSSASTEATSSNNQASAPLTIAGTLPPVVFSSGFED